MNTTLVTVLQLAGPVLLGLSVAAYLRPVLRRLLVDLCGTAERADFWLRVTVVLLALAPLAAVLLFGGNPASCGGTDAYCTSTLLRRSLGLTLLGVLGGLGTVVRAVWRQVPAATAPTGKATRATA